MHLHDVLTHFLSLHLSMHLAIRFGSSLCGILPRIQILLYLSAPVNCVCAIWVAHAYIIHHSK